MNQLTQGLAASWNDLSAGRRVLLLATAGALVALGLLLYSWSSSTNYVTLYTGLDPSDSGRIVDQLRSRGVPFQIEAGGQTVSVPEASVDELRVDFAAQGLPQGGNVGFELFDGNAFTATDFVQRLNFQRGLQGELARTIETFSAIEQARVHIVLPERSLFSSDQRAATASIVLKMRPGRALSGNEVAGVAHLVGGAVEGLEKADITIVDTSGRVIFDGRDLESGGAAGTGTSQLTLQRNYEERLELDVQQLLDRALGPGRSSVQVRAVLNFDQLETETETFLNGDGGGVPRSSTTVTESYSADGAAAAGAVPGAVANIPGLEAAADEPTTDASATTYSRTETTSNFEVGRTFTRSVRAVGGVEKLSVSLLLDDTVTEEQASSLLESVQAAVGLDEARGDVIALTRLPFDRTGLEEAEIAFAAEAATAQILNYVRLGLPVVLLIVAFVFFRLLMRSIASRGTYRVLDVAPAALAAGAGAGAAGALPAPEGVLAGAALPPVPVDIQSEMEQQVTRLAKTSPDTVASVVQSWVRED